MHNQTRCQWGTASLAGEGRIDAEAAPLTRLIDATVSGQSHSRSTLCGRVHSCPFPNLLHACHRSSDAARSPRPACQRCTLHTSSQDGVCLPRPADILHLCRTLTSRSQATYYKLSSFYQSSCASPSIGLCASLRHNACIYLRPQAGASCTCARFASCYWIADEICAAIMWLDAMQSIRIYRGNARISGEHEDGQSAQRAYRNSRWKGRHELMACGRSTAGFQENCSRLLRHAVGPLTAHLLRMAPAVYLA